MRGTGPYARDLRSIGMCRIRVPETLITLSDALGGKRQHKRNIEHLGMGCRQIPVFAAPLLIYQKSNTRHVQQGHGQAD